MFHFRFGRIQLLDTCESVFNAQEQSGKQNIISIIIIAFTLEGLIEDFVKEKPISRISA